MLKLEQHTTINKRSKEKKNEKKRCDDFYNIGSPIHTLQRFWRFLKSKKAFKKKIKILINFGQYEKPTIIARNLVVSLQCDHESFAVLPSLNRVSLTTLS